MFKVERLVQSGRALLLPALLVAACDASTTAQGSRDLASPAVPTPVSGIEQIRGAWDIVSFEGYRPQERLQGTTRAAFVDFGEGDISVRLECNYLRGPGTVRGGRFVAGRGFIGTEMGCGPEREARDARLGAFFGEWPIVETIGVDHLRLRLRSRGRELLLERPALRRLQFVPSMAALQGKWRMVELTRYEPGGGWSGGGLHEVSGRIVFSGDRLFYNRCPALEARVRLEASGRLVRTGGAMPGGGGPGIPPQGCAALDIAPAARGFAGPRDIIALLHAGPFVETSGKDQLLLSTDRLGLLLTKAPCTEQVQSDDHRTTTTRDCASPE